MARNVYDVGDLVALSALFYTTASALIDPTDVYLMYNRVYGQITGETVTAVWPDGDIERVALGHFSLQVTASAPGLWHYHWAGSGAVVGASGHGFQVRSLPFG